MEFKPNAWKLENDTNDSVSRSLNTNNNTTSKSIKPNKSESKQKVPFTLKYQLNIRKNNNNNSNASNDSSTVVNSPGPHNGLLSDLAFDQDKGQFLWATEGYQQNLKKRRMTNGNSSPKPYDLKVPRPPNAFIIYHRNKSKELAKYKSIGRCDTNERHPSKTVAEMWKDEPAEIRLLYQREADLALVEHKKKYPFYKYKPKKKDGKNKSKSQQNDNNNPSKKNNSCSIKSSNKDNKNEIINEDDDSQVPMEHRKQAAMESAFTVFDSTSIIDDNSNCSADNTSSSNYSPPQTPPTPNSAMLNTPSHWTDFADKQFFDTPINERIFTPLQLSQSQQPPCQCTAHCANNHHNATTTTLDTLSSEQWNAVSAIFNNVLESIGLINHPQTIPTTAPPSIENNIIMPIFTNSTCTNFFPQNTAHTGPEWAASLDDVTTDYVVPSQPTSVPPPTPTSPIEYLSWNNHNQSIDSQFNANPITNITNITNVMPTTPEHLSQINQQTNNILFTSTTNNDVCDLFDDSNFNFL